MPNSKAGSPSTRPDVVCLQEIKSVDEGFPAAPLEALGYNVAVHGQKGFNGVAILSRIPLEDIGAACPAIPRTCRRAISKPS